MAVTAGPATGRPPHRGEDRGSAVAEFALVASLVMVVLAGVLQLALALHVRNTLVDCAGEGARYAALHGVPLEAGAQRTRLLADSALSSAVTESVHVRLVDVGGVSMVRVAVSARLPVLGLLGPSGGLTVHGHAVVEE